MHLAVQNESEAKVGEDPEALVAGLSLSKHKGAISSLHSGTRKSDLLLLGGNASAK